MSAIDASDMPTPFDAPVGLAERLTFPTARVAYRMGFAAGGGAPLTRVAHQLGLQDVDAAAAALELGARFMAHGFSASDINAMILHHYSEEARLEARRNG